MKYVCSFMAFADGHSHSVPRWQYFDGTEKRFFLPGSLGPSWQVQRNVKDVCLSEMVDCYNRVCHEIQSPVTHTHSTGRCEYRYLILYFQLQSNDRLHIKMFECPLLLYSEVFSTFPGHGPMNPELTSIKLSYKHIEDEEKGQKFVSYILLLLLAPTGTKTIDCCKSLERLRHPIISHQHNMCESLKRWFACSSNERQSTVILGMQNELCAPHATDRSFPQSLNCKFVVYIPCLGAHCVESDSPAIDIGRLLDGFHQHIYGWV